MNEHETKYEALSKKLGVEALKRLIPATPEEIRTALAKGDQHLNSIPLPLWDHAAGVGREVSGLRWPQADLQASSRRLDLPWHKEPTLSLSERVCVLKHVAKFVLSKEQERGAQKRLAEDRAEQQKQCPSCGRFFECETQDLCAICASEA